MTPVSAYFSARSLSATLMRPVVSYDDITLPYEMTEAVVQEASSLSKSDSNSGNNKTKKRKRKSRYSNTASKNPSNEEDEDAEYLEVEESRELTHEEIWDDSALIEAWNAAAEEYQAYHGPDKGWKNEPIHKSPLSVTPYLTFPSRSRWYNTPPPPSKKQKKSQPSPPTTAVTVSVGPLPPSASAAEDSRVSGVTSTVPDPDESDSKPIDFDTFIPTHDAGLSLPPPSASAPKTATNGQVSAPDFSEYYSTASPGHTVSRDEAFKRALEATYWSGYWTAVYHTEGTVSKPVEKTTKDGEGEVDNKDVKPEDNADADAEITEKDVQAVLDIGDDGKFEGEYDMDEDEGGEYENGFEEEEAEEGDDSGADFVSTQR
ncbi:hypothetical protein GYMLUDRAFT_55959 [Collybiopsis luxurians FD-317 M1]|nr:hypothetical protein GYMLUDRAFT_55959 [Collybiopsis luxurians FD-317 M1]